MDTDDDDDGWGRLRPKIGDVPLPWDEPRSSPAAPVDADAMETAGVRRVAPLREYVLPGYDGVPCGELNQVLVNEGHAGDANRYYTLWDNGSEHQKKFTCVFTSPSTGEHFACGRWTKHKGGVTDDGPPHWYNKKSAKHAAAAKYLDCMALRECHGTEKEFVPRCDDAPYLEGEGPPLPTLPTGVALPIIDPDQIMPDGDTPANTDAPTRVKKTLFDWYVSFWRNMNALWAVPKHVECKYPEPECYSSWSNMRDDAHRRFTAIFVCPLTGEKYLSGTLGLDGEPTVDHMFYEPTRGRLLSNLRGPAAVAEHAGGGDRAAGTPLPRVDLVWYATKKGAEDAAAGRALDCLRHRGADGAPGGRCCAEEPYQRGEAPGGWRDVGEAAAAAEDMWYDGATPLEPYHVIFAVVSERERITTQFDVDDFHGLVGTSHDDEEWRRRHHDARRDASSA